MPWFSRRLHVQKMHAHLSSHLGNSCLGGTLHQSIGAANVHPSSKAYSEGAKMDDWNRMEHDGSC